MHCYRNEHLFTFQIDTLDRFYTAYERTRTTCIGIVGATENGSTENEVPKDGICKYGIRRPLSTNMQGWKMQVQKTQVYESATAENVSTAT